ncbi:DUF6151 family protein [Tateyamaria sp. SN3-11]|uniref:DUF6151 family protein n=1 Tax=Tateyamaria sp. SN3-11 TaxID=3092147 RepID=UPI0039EB8F3D
MAGDDLPFACDCGKLRGTLLGISPRSGNRIDCFCSDCRAAELYGNQPDPAPGPVKIFQTTPDRVRFDAGLDQLAVFSFSDTGILRWQARCCGALLFNTLRTPKVYFAAFRTDRLEDDSVLGPVRTRAFVSKPNGKTGHEGFANAFFNLAKQAIPARLTGRWKKTPFFDVSTGAPVRDVHVVTASERAALES